MSENLLIVNDILLPEPDIDGYHAYEDVLKVQLTMISGRMVEEVRGVVWRVDYTSGAMVDSTRRLALAALRSQRPVTAVFLPDNGTELISSAFLVESLTPPVLAFVDDDGTPVWTGLAFSLREVRPHA